jgi:peptide/nickel transport system ATP-binding protein
MSLLEIQKLSISFKTKTDDVHAIRDISFSINEGETFGLIGETGCGKSVLTQAITRLLPGNSVIAGDIRFRGTDLYSLGGRKMRDLLGKEISLIPQNPAEALDPLMKNGGQIAEAISRQGAFSKTEITDRIYYLLTELGFQDSRGCADSWPHELSGGMKQRVLAAMGMSGKPRLLIADEPTKGLDSELRGQVARMFMAFIKKTRTTSLFITHDLKFARALCDRIAVMYAGEIVEMGETNRLFESPRHPYLKSLIASMPENGLRPLRGESPSLVRLPKGCSFHPRCMLATTRCRTEHPMLDKEKAVRCFAL